MRLLRTLDRARRAGRGGQGTLLLWLYEWLDSRSLRTNAYHLPTKAERRRPMFWRYWCDLPAKGEIGVAVGSWYNDAAPWVVLPAADPDDRDIAFGHIVLETLRRNLADNGLQPAAKAPAVIPSYARRN